MGSCPAMWLGTGELVPSFAAFRDDLIRRLAVEHALAEGVVGGVEPAQELLEVTVRVNGDAQHLPADPTIKALHHAIGNSCQLHPQRTVQEDIFVSLSEPGRVEALAFQALSLPTFCSVS
jgi:hypothetical protein